VVATSVGHDLAHGTTSFTKPEVVQVAVPDQEAEQQAA
jgi:hypothetical protein